MRSDELFSYDCRRNFTSLVSIHRPGGLSLLVGDGITMDGADIVLTENKATGNKKFGIIVVGDDISAAAASTGNVVSGNRNQPQCSIYGVTTPPTCIQK